MRKFMELAEEALRVNIFS